MPITNMQFTNMPITNMPATGSWDMLRLADHKALQDLRSFNQISPEHYFNHPASMFIFNVISDDFNNQGLCTTAAGAVHTQDIID